ncbi:WXG100 family type VII secretion target [Aestuariimicrobium soli]|uniref:WXG100 family type VII secretion target n=1 Tax=Aestuariimicrobium soli TaxID=2035834 RepID=UPI003EC09345
MSNPTLANRSFGGAELKLPVYSDLVNATQALGDGKLRFNDVTSLADTTLGILNTALDPLGALIGSAVGFLVDWLVKNVEFIKKPVDWLLGAPDQISEVSQKWRQTGTSIAEHGNAFVGSLGTLSTWEGPASEAYKGVVRHCHALYQQANEAANGVAGWVNLAGAVVKTFREFMLQMLKDFITEVVKAALLAAASAIPSFGASIGAFTSWFSARMAMMAGKFSKTLSKLMTKMGDLVKKLGGSGRSFYVAAEKLRQAASRFGRSAARGFGNSGIPGGPTPRLPGDTRVPFNQNMPGYKGFNDAYKWGKRVTGGVDKAADASDAGAPAHVNDLPEGY